MRIAGMALAVAGLVPLARNARIVLTGDRANAQVVAVVTEAKREAPILEFRTRDGRTVTFQGSYVRGHGHYSVGQSWPVVYLPSAPNEAEVDSFWNLWSSGFLVVLGAVFLAFPSQPKRRARR
jgi:hypothetical protein